MRKQVNKLEKPGGWYPGFFVALIAVMMLAVPADNRGYQTILPLVILVIAI
ncbi:MULTISPECIES: hypothetical protein [Bacillus]|uniref:hypothetical protein n=1 Tax=Bacillus TaxID=1386 RepID=UPI0015E0FE89|nr:MULTISPECIES: hypothetical protein [Bacillus]MCC8354020.1 hypothetical protein [Bacillus sp. AF23]